MHLDSAVRGKSFSILPAHWPHPTFFQPSFVINSIHGFINHVGPTPWYTTPQAGSMAAPRNKYVFQTSVSKKQQLRLSWHILILLHVHNISSHRNDDHDFVKIRDDPLQSMRSMLDKRKVAQEAKGERERSRSPPSRKHARTSRHSQPTIKSTPVCSFVIHSTALGHLFSA